MDPSGLKLPTGHHLQMNTKTATMMPANPNSVSPSRYRCESPIAFFASGPTAVAAKMLCRPTARQTKLTARFNFISTNKQLWINKFV